VGRDVETLTLPGMAQLDILRRHFGFLRRRVSFTNYVRRGQGRTSVRVENRLHEQKNGMVGGALAVSRFCVPFLRCRSAVIRHDEHAYGGSEGSVVRFLLGDGGAYYFCWEMAEHTICMVVRSRRQISVRPFHIAGSSRTLVRWPLAVTFLLTSVLRGSLEAGEGAGGRVDKVLASGVGMHFSISGYAII
jgi:hypothetical protein